MKNIMLLQRLGQHKIVKFIAALTAVFCLFFITIIVFSEPIIRALITTKGGALVGRELAIDGDFTIHWHWHYTAVHATGVRLGNAPGYDEPNMLTIESLDFTFKPLRLLWGELEFGVININRPYLVLERKTATDANWEFPLVKAKSPSDAATSDQLSNFPFIKQLDIEKGQLIYRDALKSIKLKMELSTVERKAGGEVPSLGSEINLDVVNQFKIAGDGLVQKNKFRLEAVGGSLANLRDSSEDFPLQLKLVMGDTQVVIKGTFKDPVKLTGMKASLKISGHNLADLFYLTAIPLPPTPPYQLEGELNKNANLWSYNHFKGTVGTSDLGGDLSYDVGGARGFLKAKLFSNLLNSQDLGGFIGLSAAGKNAAPEQKKAAAEKKISPDLIPDVPLKLERLRTTDLDVSLQANKIIAPNLPFKGLDTRFYFKNGILKLDPLKLVLADGTVSGVLELDANSDKPPMKMDLNLHRLSLGQFFTNTRFAGTTAGFFGGNVKLAGSGASLADVLASSNGNITLLMVGGKISLLLIEASDLDIAEALPLFLGRDKSTGIRCGVTDFKVSAGILTSKVVIFDTDDSLLTGNVVIDMKKELINAKLDAKPKDASLLSLQTPLVVSGKLKAPRVGLEGSRASSRGLAAAALGALLVPFAAFLPFIETGDAQDVDCRALIMNAGK